MNEKSSQEIATVNKRAKYGKRNSKRNKISGAKRITYIATLIAASLAFKLLGNYLNFGSLKLSLVYIPWMISGIVMGPLGGATVALATDVLGQFIVPAGGFAPLPLLALSNALFGLITGLIFKLPRLDNHGKLWISTAIVIFVCTLGISTYALSDLYGMPFKAEFVLRLPQALIVCFNAAVVGLLFPLLIKLGLMDGSTAPKKKEEQADEEDNEKEEKSQTETTI